MVRELVKIGTGQTKDIAILDAEELSKYLIKIDDVSASISYYAWAECGTVDGDALWRILKKTIVGTVTTYAWADGNQKFDNVWTNRTSLTYT